MSELVAALPICTVSDIDDSTDEDILRRWNDFKTRYDELGYRAASYKYFSFWLQRDLNYPRLSAADIRRRLHAYRKRRKSRDR